MSWHFLQGQEEASWEGSSLDGAPSVLLKFLQDNDKGNERAERVSVDPLVILFIERR